MINSAIATLYGKCKASKYNYLWKISAKKKDIISGRASRPLAGLRAGLWCGMARPMAGTQPCSRLGATRALADEALHWGWLWVGYGGCTFAQGHTAALVNALCCTLPTGRCGALSLRWLRKALWPTGCWAHSPVRQLLHHTPWALHPGWPGRYYPGLSPLQTTAHTRGYALCCPLHTGR
jgi:hypothetical protein